jgi:hypothetical protein
MWRRQTSSPDAKDWSKQRTVVPDATERIWLDGFERFNIGIRPNSDLSIFLECVDLCTKMRD